ncbi:MAG: hypothetical protein P4M09_18040 [Devosia sp.]|nr:hypothetical protein [Devosia sp.]
MIAIGVICSVIGIGTLCWLLFTFATLAFPLFVAVSVGIWLSTHGMDSLAAGLLGAIAGMVTLGIGQLVFVMAQATWLRLLVGVVYVVPAGVAGYYAALRLAELGPTSDVWKVAIAAVGATAVGVTALARLAALVPTVHHSQTP